MQHCVAKVGIAVHESGDVGLGWDGVDRVAASVTNVALRPGLTLLSLSLQTRQLWNQSVALGRLKRALASAVEGVREVVLAVLSLGR